MRQDLFFIVMVTLSVHLVGMELIVDTSEMSQGDYWRGRAAKNSVWLAKALTGLITEKKISISDENRWIKENCPHELYTLFLEQSNLLPEIINRIAHMLMRLKCGTSDNFNRELFYRMIQLNDRKTSWMIPTAVKESFDKKYYISMKLSGTGCSSAKIYNCGSIKIYDCSTQMHCRTFDRVYKYSLASNKNRLLLHIFGRLGNGFHSVYDIDTNTEYIFMEEVDFDHVSMSNFDRAVMSNDGNHIACADNNNVIVWNITDLNKVVSRMYAHQNVAHVAFSIDNLLLASACAKGGTKVQLWSVDGDNEEAVASCDQSDMCDTLVFANDSYDLILSHGMDGKNKLCSVFKIDKDSSGRYRIQQQNELLGSHLLYTGDTQSPAAGIDYCMCGPGITFMPYGSGAEKQVAQVIEGGLVDRMVWSNSREYVATLDDTTQLMILTCIRYDKECNNVVVSYLQSYEQPVKEGRAFSRCTWMEFNAESTLFLRGCRDSLGVTAYIYGLDGKLLRRFFNHNCDAIRFHPDGYSVLTRDFAYELYSSETQKQLKKTVREANISTYLVMDEVLSAESSLLIKENSWLDRMYKQLLKPTRDLCTDSFKVSISENIHQLEMSHTKKKCTDSFKVSIPENIHQLEMSHTKKKCVIS